MMESQLKATPSTYPFATWMELLQPFMSHGAKRWTYFPSSNEMTGRLYFAGVTVLTAFFRNSSGPSCPFDATAPKIASDIIKPITRPCEIDMEPPWAVWVIFSNLLRLPRGRQNMIFPGETDKRPPRSSRRR